MIGAGNRSSISPQVTYSHPVRKPLEIIDPSTGKPIDLEKPAGASQCTSPQNKLSDQINTHTNTHTPLGEDDASNWQTPDELPKTPSENLARSTCTPQPWLRTDAAPEQIPAIIPKAHPTAPTSYDDRAKVPAGDRSFHFRSPLRTFQKTGAPPYVKKTFVEDQLKEWWDETRARVFIESILGVGVDPLSLLKPTKSASTPENRTKIAKGKINSRKVLNMSLQPETTVNLNQQLIRKRNKVVNVATPEPTKVVTKSVEKRLPSSADEYSSPLPARNVKDSLSPPSQPSPTTSKSPPTSRLSDISVDVSPMTPSKKKKVPTATLR